MTPIGQPCTCEPMTWLYFVFRPIGVRVCRAETLAAVVNPDGLTATGAPREILKVGLCTLNSFDP
jgi:hypothetical protein